MKKRLDKKALLISLVSMILVSLIGSFFTIDNVNSSWYENNKPTITPPSYVFGPVWTFLYVLIGISFYMALTIKDKKLKKTLVSLFALNLVANVLWSYLFFNLKIPTLALIALLLILSSATLIIILAWNKNRKISSLMTPYILWLIFAGILNLLFIF